MRVTGGSLKNRRIDVPDTSQTRPLTDEIREAIFNILGPLDDFVVLDAYAGSGVAGIEAISRGAVHVDGVEIAKNAVEAISNNVKSLGLESSYHMHHQSIEDWLLKNGDKKDSYDLIFIDPPFDSFSAEVAEKLAEFLQPKGLAELRIRADVAIPEFKNMEPIKSKQYGKSKVTFYKRV